jgi:hypothetical protein
MRRQMNAGAGLHGAGCGDGGETTELRAKEQITPADQDNA